MIRNMHELQVLVANGWTDWAKLGDVNAVTWDELILFNYTNACQFKPLSAWNWFERNARGLILNRETGEIVARPFRKFANYGQEMPKQGTRIVEVTEKIDGSLGILYWKDGDGWRIATRGSFSGDQAVWATDFFRRNWNWTPAYSDYTLLFEIVYPANRVVVNYGDLEELVLIGARHKEHGHEMYYQELKAIASKHGFMQPRTYDFSDWTQILEAAEALSANEEGWVIRTSDNERYKVKGDAYKIAHKLMTGVSYSRVLDAVEIGRYEWLIEGVPDEFLTEVRGWKDQIDGEASWIEDVALSYFRDAPKDDRKTFALWCQQNTTPTVRPMLFALLDGKDIKPLIYKSMKKGRI